MDSKISKALALAGAAAALAFPALAAAKNGNGHGHGHGNGPSKQHGQGHGPRATSHVPQSKPRNYIVKGTVTDIAGNIVTIAVTHSNHHGAGLVGPTPVQFDLTNARVVGRVHDPSGVKKDDRVVVQARLPRDLTGTPQPYAARKLVDRGQPQASQDQTQSDQSTTGGDATHSD
jgi:hypothetical protein